jgi:hypothetical protein
MANVTSDYKLNFCWGCTQDPASMGPRLKISSIWHTVICIQAKLCGQEWAEQALDFQNAAAVRERERVCKHYPVYIIMTSSKAGRDETRAGDGWLRRGSCAALLVSFYEMIV